MADPSGKSFPKEGDFFVVLVLVSAVGYCGTPPPLSPCPLFLPWVPHVHFLSLVLSTLETIIVFKLL